MIDISKPEKPILIEIFLQGNGTGLHFHRFSRDQKRLVVSGYFLNEDDFGKVHMDGDRKIHVLKIGKNGLSEDLNFNVDFNNIVEGKQYRPHGMDVWWKVDE